jgi:hypothetical protein
MDPNRFDTLARSLMATSRRHVLGILSSSAVGVLTPLLQRADVEAGKRKKKKKKKKKKGITPVLPAPPPFCASQPDGAPCGFCRRCQSGTCAADMAQNDAACGSDGTGRCLNGVCNPRPTCSFRGEHCNTVADCCSAGSTKVITRCDTTFATCEGRSDTGQPCLDSGLCWPGAAGCIGYVCQ